MRHRWIIERILDKAELLSLAMRPEILIHSISNFTLRGTYRVQYEVTG